MFSEQELITKGQFCIFSKKKFTTKRWYNSLTREWQLRRGNSSRKSWWSGKSTYFVGIFWAPCQLAVSTYLLKHDYSARKDWADSVSITSAVSHFLPERCSLDRFSASLSRASGLGKLTKCSSAHVPPWIYSRSFTGLFLCSQWECWLKIHAQKVSDKPFVSFLPGPVRMVPMWGGWWGAGGALGQIKERMWPSAGDTFHSFHALIAIRKVSVCFYCIQHRHCRPKLWLYSQMFLVLQQFSSCSEPTTRSRPVPINSSSVKLFPAWSFKILFCGKQDAKKIAFQTKTVTGLLNNQTKAVARRSGKKGKKLGEKTPRLQPLDVLCCHRREPLLCQYDSRFVKFQKMKS